MDLTITQCTRTLQHTHPDAYAQDKPTTVVELPKVVNDEGGMDTVTHTYTQCKNTHTTNTNQYVADLEVNFDAMGVSYRIGEANYWVEEDREGVG